MLPFAPKIQLTLITAEILKNPPSVTLKKQLEELGCYAVFLLHDNHGIAINFTNKPLDRSVKGEQFEIQSRIKKTVYEFLKPLRATPKFNFLSPNTRQFESLTLGVPDPRFEIVAQIPKGEIDKNWFPMSSYLMKNWHPMEIRIFFDKKSKVDNQNTIFNQIRQWHREATSIGFGDEVMQSGEVKIGESFLSKKGLLVFPIIIPYLKPVTYPWLELWLRLRLKNTLPRNCKGIEFVNPTNSK